LSVNDIVLPIDIRINVPPPPDHEPHHAQQEDGDEI